MRRRNLLALGATIRAETSLKVPKGCNPVPQGTKTCLPSRCFPAAFCGQLRVLLRLLFLDPYFLSKFEFVRDQFAFAAASPPIPLRAPLQIILLGSFLRPPSAAARVEPARSNGETAHNDAHERAQEVGTPSHRLPPAEARSTGSVQGMGVARGSAWNPIGARKGRASVRTGGCGSGTLPECVSPRPWPTSRLIVAGWSGPKSTHPALPAACVLPESPRGGGARHSLLPGGPTGTGRNVTRSAAPPAAGPRLRPAREAALGPEGTEGMSADWVGSESFLPKLRPNPHHPWPFSRQGKPLVRHRPFSAAARQGFRRHLTIPTLIQEAALRRQPGRSGGRLFPWFQCHVMGEEDAPVRVIHPGRANTRQDAVDLALHSDAQMRKSVRVAPFATLPEASNKRR